MLLRTVCKTGCQTIVITEYRRTGDDIPKCLPYLTYSSHEPSWLTYVKEVLRMVSLKSKTGTDKIALGVKVLQKEQLVHNRSLYQYLMAIKWHRNPFYHHGKAGNEK